MNTKRMFLLKEIPSSLIHIDLLPSLAHSPIDIDSLTN